MLQPFSLKDEYDRGDDIQNALDRREKAWLGIMRHGSATLSEIMVADFGTKNPVGLDIDHWNGDPTINFNITPKQKKFLGSVTFAEPEIVNIHSVFNILKKLPLFPLQKNAADMFSHEVIHCRQGFERQFGIFNAYRGFLDNVNPQDQEAIEKTDKIEKSSLRRSFGKYKIKGYLDNEVEIHARMHEIFSNAYHDWGRMPSSGVELLAAMHHLGAKVPLGLVSELFDSEQGQKALKDFQVNPVTKDATARPVSLLNRVYEYGEACGMDSQHWKSSNSYLYGTLLELYGDTKGRERMFDDVLSTHSVAKAIKSVHGLESVGRQDIEELSADVPDRYTSFFIIALRNCEETRDTAQLFEQALLEQGRISHRHIADASPA